MTIDLLLFIYTDEERRYAIIRPKLNELAPKVPFKLSV